MAVCIKFGIFGPLLGKKNYLALGLGPYKGPKFTRIKSLNSLNKNYHLISVDLSVTKKQFTFPKKHNMPFYYVSASDGTNVVKVSKENSFPECYSHYLGLIESITSIGSRVKNLGQGWYNITNQSRCVAKTGMWRRITGDRDLSLWIRY